jgi:hypothetical protein
MDPLQLAAQFAAFTWFTECYSGKASADEATKFARENWPAFRNHAPAGLGRLLIRVGRLEEQPRDQATRRRGAGRRGRAAVGLAG